MSDIDDLLSALQPVAEFLDQLGVRYYVGGSVASSFHGASRSTIDVDLNCEMRADHVSALLESLGNEFYASETAIREAIRHRSCFNLIHYPTGFKIDVFVNRGRDFDLDSLARARRQPLASTSTLHVPILSAEDTIVTKLEWFRLSNETSERQWDDVSRLVGLLHNKLDGEHLRQIAKSIGVGDLLEKLLESN